MNKYVSMRIRRNDFKANGSKKFKTFQQQLEHDTRTEKIEKGYLKRPELQHLNQTFSPIGQEVSEATAKALWQKAKDDYKTHNGRSLQSKTKPIVTAVITFSNSINDDLEKYGADNVTAAINNFLLDRFGESLIYSSFHFDETTYHAHASFVNHDFKTHKSISRNIDTSKLQDEIADYLKEALEWDYVRGQDKDVTKAKHLEVREAQAKQVKQLQEEQSTLIDEFNTLVDEYNELLEGVNELKGNLNELYNDLMELDQAKNDATFKKLFNTLIKHIKNENKEKVEQVYNKIMRRYKAINKKGNRTI